MLAITISALYIIFGVITIFTLGGANYISLAVNLVIILYLLLSKDVRTAFASEKPVTTAIILAVLAVLVYAAMEYPNLTPKQTAMEQALNQMQQVTNELKKYQTTSQNSGTNLNQTGGTTPSQPDANPNQNPVPTPNSGNSNASPISNGIYTNSKYGFQMSVPDGTSYFEDNQSPPTDSFMFINSQQVSIFGITITPATDSLEAMANKTTGFDPNQTTHTIIGGEQALQCNTNASGPSVFNFYLIHNGNFYELDQGRSLTTSDFTFWLNTFKFTK